MYIKIRKRDAPVSPDFFAEAERIFKEYEGKRFIDLREEIEKHFKEIKPIGGNKFAYSDEISEAFSKGYVPPSIFNAWRYCGRKVFLQAYTVAKHRRNIVTREQIKAIVRGLAVHELYRSKYAVGDTEVKLVSDTLKIYGIADEVRKDPTGKYVVVEVKSGYVRDPVGPSLQVMAYMAVIMEKEGVSEEDVDGYVISLNGAYKVMYDRAILEEYLKRVRAVVEAALAYASGDDEAVNKIPPRLPLNLVSRCRTCSYSGLCQRLPSPTLTYSKYFAMMGFRKLVEIPQNNTLLRYIRGGRE